MMARGVALLLGLAMALHPLAAPAEEAAGDTFELLQRLRQQFREGSYEEAIATGRVILEAEPSTLVRAEAHQYVGASAELLGRTEMAEEHFEELLTVLPTFQLEQSEFPTEVLTLFETIRLRYQDRIRLADDARRRAAEAERLERERRLRDEAARLAALAEPRYMMREVRRRHLAIAFLPFGAGQFQNDMPGRGYAFMFTELGLTAASMVLWILHATMPTDVDDRAGARDLRLGYEYASYAVYGALGVAVVWGIIDALVNFRAESVRWSEIEESDVPEEHRLEIELPSEEEGSAARP